MEQNNQAPQEYKTLRKHAEEAYFGSTKHAARYDLENLEKFLHETKDMTPEEREVEANKIRNRGSLKSVIDGYFEAVTEKTLSIKYLMATPPLMAQHLVVGSDYVVRIALGLIDPTKEIVKDFRNELGSIIYRHSTVISTARKLLQRDFIGDETTYAEVVWLYKLCSWLGCHTSTLCMEIEDLTSRARSDENFNFTNTIGVDPKVRGDKTGQTVHVDDSSNTGLRYAVTQQYQILEQLLNRL